MSDTRVGESSFGRRRSTRCANRQRSSSARRPVSVTKELSPWVRSLAPPLATPSSRCLHVGGRNRRKSDGQSDHAAISSEPRIVGGPAYGNRTTFPLSEFARSPRRALATVADRRQSAREFSRDDGLDATVRRVGVYSNDVPQHQGTARSKRCCTHRTGIRSR